MCASHEIDVGTVAEREEHGRTDRRQPLDRRCLSEVPLLPAVDPPLHHANICRGADGNVSLARLDAEPLDHLLVEGGEGGHRAHEDGQVGDPALLVELEEVDALQLAVADAWP